MIKLKQLLKEAISIDELNIIAKQVVKDIGENLSCDLQGKCGQISKEIYKRLKKLGIKCDVIEITAGYIGNETKESFTTHYYVFVYNGNIIIDTQLWQIKMQPKNLDKRKVVFTYSEYNKYFRPTDTEKIT